MDIVKQEWYQALVEECKAIVTEAVFTSRWALVEGYWNLGERIRTDQQFQEHAKGNHSSFQDLGQKLGISTSTIYYSLQFYDKYPDLSKVPEGKNISWNKLITKYLPEFKENKIDMLKNPVKEKSTLITIPRNRLSLTNFPSKYFRVDISGLNLSGTTRLDISFDDLHEVQEEFDRLLGKGSESVKVNISNDLKESNEKSFDGSGKEMYV